jgi:hypothetical protein
MFERLPVPVLDAEQRLLEGKGTAVEAHSMQRLLPVWMAAGSLAKRNTRSVFTIKTPLPYPLDALVFHSPRFVV